MLPWKENPTCPICVEPFAHAGGLKLVPALNVGQHMHEIEIDMVGAQAAQLLGKIALEIPFAAHKILRQFRCDAHLVPAVVAVKNFAERGLAARVDVGCVKVVHPGPDRGEHLPLGLFKVDSGALAGKPHAAVSQQRDGAACLVIAILHGAKPLFCVLWYTNQYTAAAGF